MSFEELCNHIQEEGCNIIQLAEDLYFATNCINANCCMIEKLDFYGTATLSHYIYELNVEVPEKLTDFFNVYTNGRDALMQSELKF